jgi:hypothetical protein
MREDAPGVPERELLMRAGHCGATALRPHLCYGVCLSLVLPDPISQRYSGRKVKEGQDARSDRFGRCGEFLL